MMKKKLVIGNWKMNPRIEKDALKLFQNVAKNLGRVKKTEVVVCPPSLYISKLRPAARKIVLGAQNAYIGETGAFTGEISPQMLYEAGVRYVILGHSERRALGESDQVINKKIRSSLEAGLIPVLCVGESERDEGHSHFEIVKNQVRDCLAGVPKNSFPKIVIAYEPVWAISTTVNRRDATAADSLEMTIYIRKTLADMSSAEISGKMRMIYGGSVNDKDAEEFLKYGGVDGVLPGKASLDPEKFVRIVKICEALKN
jgi:triosephosphate isomerase (TIM)